MVKGVLVDLTYSKETKVSGPREFVALVGVNYGKKDTRVEPGQRHRFPADVAKNLLEQGAIRPVESQE